MPTLTVDIETCPTTRQDIIDEIRSTKQAELDAAIAGVKPPGQYKKAESIAEWMENEAPKVIANLRDNFEADVQAALHKTCLDGAAGQIIAIGYALDDGKPGAFAASSTALDQEAALLCDFYAWLDESIPAREHLQTCVVGHSVVSFDLRFMVQRSIVHGIRPHTVIRRAATAKPWETELVFDTMTVWAGLGKTISLDRLCKALGLPGKNGFDGSQVWAAAQAGEFQKIADYAADDAKKTRNVHRRMTYQSIL